DISSKALPLSHPQSRSAGKSPGNCRNHLLHNPLEIEKASVPCPSCSPSLFTVRTFWVFLFLRRFCFLQQNPFQEQCPHRKDLLFRQKEEAPLFREPLLLHCNIFR